jgi:hypothetical protein
MAVLAAGLGARRLYQLTQQRFQLITFTPAEPRPAQLHAPHAFPVPLEVIQRY